MSDSVDQNNRLVKQTVRRLAKNIEEEFGVKCNYTTALRIFNNLNVMITKEKDSQDKSQGKDFKVNYEVLIDELKKNPQDVIVGGVGQGKFMDESDENPILIHTDKKVLPKVNDGYIWADKSLMNNKTPIYVGTVGDKKSYWDYTMFPHIFLSGVESKGKNSYFNYLLQKATNISGKKVFAAAVSGNSLGSKWWTDKITYSKSSKLEDQLETIRRFIKDFHHKQNNLDFNETFLFIDDMDTLRALMPKRDKDMQYFTHLQESLEYDKHPLRLETYEDLLDSLITVLTMGRSFNSHIIVSGGKVQTYKEEGYSNLFTPFVYYSDKVEDSIMVNNSFEMTPPMEIFGGISPA